MNRFIERYAGLVTHHPYLVLLLIVLASVLAVQMAGTVGTKEFVIKELLPPDVEAINTIKIIEDNFGNTDTIFFAVEIDPAYKGSDEVRDVRDARVIWYLDQLSELAMHTGDVLEVRGPAQILRSINNGRLPQSTREVQELSNKNGLLASYFSRDK